MLKYKITYLAVLLLLWFIRVMYSFRIMTVLFYVFLMMPFVFLVLLLFQAARIRVGLNVEKTIVEKKTSFPVEIRVENKNFLPLGKLVVKLKYRNVLSKRWTKKKLEFSAGRGTQSCCFIMSSDYSAKLEVRLRSVKLYDILNLFSIRKLSRKKREESAVSVIVLPNLHELEESPVRSNPHIMIESDLYSDIKSGDDSTEIFNIREYMQGDRMNRIHWKLSVKEDSLMVKEFGLPVDCSVLILTDIGYHGRRKEYLRYRDTVLEAALSLSYRMVLDGQVHFLAWYDSGKKEVEKVRISNEEDFYGAAGMILQCGIALKNINTPLSYFAEYYREQYSNIFYVTADSASLDGARAMTENRKSAWLSLIFVRESGEMQEAELLKDDGVTLEIISPDSVREDMNRIVCRKGGALWEEV